MDRRLKKRCIHDVSHYVCTGRDGYGDKTFDPPIVLKAYRHGKISKIVNLSGDEDISSLQLILDGILPISGDDEFFAFDNTYPVKAFSHFDGLKAGTGTTVVFL
jgi:hypothetical protein